MKKRFLPLLFLVAMTLAGADFKVKEITEITGYNEEIKDVEYRYIYRREE